MREGDFFTMGGDGYLWGLAIISLIIFLQAVLSAVKAALNSVNETSIKKKAENGSKKSDILLHILKTPDDCFLALELLLVLSGLMTGIVYYSFFLPAIEVMVINSSLNIDISLVRPIYHVLFTALLVLASTLFGIVLPAKFARKNSESFSYQVIGFVRVISFILKPVTWLVRKLMNLVLRIFGIKPSSLAESLTEEEIISMVNEGHEQGVFDAGEAEMISNIIELDEKEAQDIMTPKKRIVAISSEMTTEDALHYMLSENYSRYPLYEGNRDNIIGILHLKDIICAYLSEELRSKSLSEIAREPYFVPDTQNINILFHEMQQKNIHMAIVIDEYGQTAGLVAMEDFIEEIVGNIQDEYDEDEAMVVSVEEEAYVVKGSISLEALEDELNIIIEHEDFDTLNGLLISILDRIPADGEQAVLEYQGYSFNILETSNKMIQLVRISKLTRDEENSKDTEYAI